MEPKGLKVSTVSCLIEENGPAHHTDDYETDALIVRRGTPFYLEIFHEGFDECTDRFDLELATTKHPKKRDGSLIEILNQPCSKDASTYQITSKSDQSLRVKVNLPADTLVSRYTLSIVTSLTRNKKKRKVEFEVPKPVYVLFNPWCEDDEVYMEDMSLKDEYVLNDEGWVFCGGQRPRPWYFGQFTDAALQCTFKLLETRAPTVRDNAREVSRHMSAMCNNCDNDGLLVGNWSGDYSDGVKPWMWSGSVKIFKQYLETGAPVEYGQCWVFSGLTTSMMRCLGIPARSVTNYDSAHDTDNNCTFDRYLDENGDYLEDESDDSCWNFHVWNDVWMARPDLPAGMGGWQAIDGTPQEESKGFYRCGPCSLQAIREGEVNYKYDTRFVFAEVNADTVYWMRNPGSTDEPWSVVRVKSNNVGTDILTKAPNRYWPENITNQYKHRDGSTLERAAVQKALKKAKNPVITKKETEVKFSSKVPWNVTSEEPINFKINARNTTSKSLRLVSVVTAHVVRYNGVKIMSLPVQRKEEAVEANSSTALEYQYDASGFVEYLDENVSLRFVMVCRVPAINEVYVSQKICNVHKSVLKIETLDQATTVNGGDTLRVKITIPSIFGLDTYTGCSIEVDSPIAEDCKMDLGDLAADGSVVLERSFKIKNLKKARESELVVTFDSNEISGITGTLQLKVQV